MKIEGQNTESRAHAPQRRPYRSPELKCLGTVAELTLTGGSKAGGDAQPFSTTHKGTG
jgi:hypothetical protein